MQSHSGDERHEGHVIQEEAERARGKLGGELREVLPSMSEKGGVKYRDRPVMPSVAMGLLKFKCWRFHLEIKIPF